MASLYIGYALLAVGLVLLLFTFMLGYGLYNQTRQASSQQTSLPANGTINATLAGGVGSMVSSVIGAEGTIIQIVLMFLFASIGYKVAALGVNVLRGPNIVKQSRQDEQYKNRY